MNYLHCISANDKVISPFRKDFIFTKLRICVVLQKNKTLTKISEFTIHLFVLILYISVNNFSVMSGKFPVFLGKTSTKQRIKCFAQGHNTVSTVSFEPVTL